MGAWARGREGAMTLGVLTAIVVAGSWSASLAFTPSRPRALPPSSAAVRDADIAFYEARAARDPYGATDRSRLAALLLERARITAAESDFSRAAEVAESSLVLRQSRNEMALLVLIGARMGQHRFVEALDAARQLQALDATRPRTNAVLGEVLLELGRYDEADSAFSAVPDINADPSTLARLARWHELRGRIDTARELLLRAHQAAEKAYGSTTDSRAWFELRAGELAARYGHAAAARRFIIHALAESPDDHRVLTSAARLAVTERRWSDAAQLAGKALAIAPDPTALALVARAEQHLGNAVASERAFRAMEVAVIGQSSTWHRDWGIVLLDEGRRVHEVLVRATADVEQRRDVYTLDLYAWALYHNGQHESARRIIDEALAVGVRDPQLLRHARLIRGEGK